MANWFHCRLIASEEGKEVVRSIPLKDLGPIPRDSRENEEGDACWFYDELRDLPEYDDNYCPKWECEGDRLVLNFDTANQPPMSGAVARLSEKYPSVRFELRYGEPINGDQGWVVFRRGYEMAMMQGYDIEGRCEF